MKVFLFLFLLLCASPAWCDAPSSAASQTNQAQGPAKETNCTNSDSPECHIDYAASKIKAMGDQINSYALYLRVAALAAVILGIISTIVISLQNDDNKSWTRPIGLVSTTVSAGLITLLTTFHVQDNISKLIVIRSDLAKLSNTLEHDVRTINSGTSDDKGKAAQIDQKLYDFSQAFLEKEDEASTLNGRIDISKP